MQNFSRRRGFSALLLIVGAAFLMTIWALAQHFTQTAIRKRVRIAEGGRRSLMLATSAIEEGLESILAEVNEPPPEDEGEDDELGLGEQLRTIEPGSVIHFSYEPNRAEEAASQDNLKISRVDGQAFLIGVYANDGEPPEDFPCQKYKRYLIKWSQVPG